MNMAKCCKCGNDTNIPQKHIEEDSAFLGMEVKAKCKDCSLTERK